MTLEEFRKATIGALKSNHADFASKESKDTIIRNAMLEYCGFDKKEFNAKDLRRNQAAIFEVLEEAIDEIVPETVKNQMGTFAEIRNIQRNESQVFTIKHTNASKRRALGAIKNGARGGIYETRRLDGTSMTVETDTVTVGYKVTLEEILIGSTNFSDMVALITAGFEERIYIEVIKELRTLKTSAAITGFAVNEAGINTTVLDTLIRNVSTYGQPVLIGFPTLLDKFSNAVMNGTTLVKYLESDAEDIKRTGRVAVYKGKTFVELPNYLAGGYNEWLFKEGDLFILPTQNNKPVKIVFKGEGTMIEFVQPTGSKIYSFHKLLGVGILTGDGIGIYTDSELSEGIY